MSKGRWSRTAVIIVCFLAVFTATACGDLVFGEPKQGNSEGAGKAYVDSVEVIMLESFPVQVQAVIQGSLADGCTEISEVGAEYDRKSQTFNVTITASRDPELMCTQVLVPFEKTVSLDVKGFKAGAYTIKADGAEANFTFSIDNE